MLKTIITLLVFIPSLSWAKIYNCEVKYKFTTQQFIIEYDENQKGYALASINPETGIFDENSKFHFYSHSGKLTKLGTSNKSFDLILQHSSDKGDGNSFRAFFIDDSLGSNKYLVSITIKDWLQDSPIYVYDDYFNEIYEGSCK